MKKVSFIVLGLLVCGTLPVFAQGSFDSTPSLIPMDNVEKNTSLPMPEPSKEEAKKQADIAKEQLFEQALERLMPLRPDQIKRVIKEFGVVRKAADERDPIPEPVIRVINISTEPGVTPPTIKTTTGMITTLAILDATGEPWPINDIGWAGQFDIIPPAQGGHILRITPMAPHAFGNMIIDLVGMDTPFSLTMTTDKSTTDYRVDVRIPNYGPLASVPIVETGGLSAVAGDPTLTSVLDGSPPSDAEKMDIDGADLRTKAWQHGNFVYLKTPLTLLSPSWDKSVTSADGTTVYSLKNTPVVLLSDKGRVVRAKLSNKEPE